MKRMMISTFLALVILIGLVPMIAMESDASGNDIIASGLWDFGPVTWKVTMDGTLTIEGNTVIQPSSTYIWKDYSDIIIRIVIADGITYIPPNAFSGMENVTSVYIGNEVTVIDEHAFSSCLKLTEVNIPASVTEIGRTAFGYCPSLRTLSFAEGSQLILIEEYAFTETAIEALTTPPSLTEIGLYAFQNCRSLKTVKLREGLQTIKPFAFSGCTGLYMIEMPASMESIYGYAFENVCATVYYPATVDEIWKANIPHQYEGILTWIQYENVSVGSVAVTENSDGSYDAAPNVSGGYGQYAYNYWLFDSTGTIVDRHENTFDTSWTFQKPDDGIYLMRVYATDFGTESYNDSSWFAVTAPYDGVEVSKVTVVENEEGTYTATADVTGGSGFYAYNYWLFDSTGTIVDRHENTFDTSWTFEKPDDGIYLMRIYATDFTTDAYNDSSWFAVTSPYENVAVSNVTVTENEDGTYTATADVTGGSGFYAYNYWLFDSTGTIVDRHENTFDTSWTFEKPENGIYLMRIYATDFTTDSHGDGPWFAVAD